MADSTVTTLAGPVIIEGPPLAQFRWLVSARNEFDRVLQQAVQMQRGGIRWIEWRDVPEIAAPDSSEGRDG